MQKRWLINQVEEDRVTHLQHELNIIALLSHQIHQLLELRCVAVSHGQRLGNERFELVEALVGSHGRS